MFEVEIEAARAELASKSYLAIQRETAVTWCARACAAYQFQRQAQLEGNGDLALHWLLVATDADHEAIEHAALTGDTGLLLQVRNVLETNKRG